MAKGKKSTHTINNKYNIRDEREIIKTLYYINRMIDSEPSAKTQIISKMPINENLNEQLY